MRIKPPANQDQAPRSKKGSLVIRVTKRGIVGTKWPPKREAASTGYEMYRQQEMAIAGSWATNPEPIALQSALNLAKGTEYVPRDILTLAEFGLLMQFSEANGIALEPSRMSQPNPQYILDLVGNVEGSILRRDPIGWVLLLPGDEGEVLSMQSGFPHWLPQQAPSLAEFVVASPYAALPNAYQLKSSTSALIVKVVGDGIYVLRAALTGDVAAALNDNVLTIQNGVVTYAKLQNVSATSHVLGRKSAGPGSAEELTLSDILDFVGSAAQGDILFRSSTGWTRLAAGTSGQVLETQGAGANPQWHTPTSTGGIDIQTFTVAGSYTGPSGWQKPAGAKIVEVYVTGAAAGGGSGRRGPTTENTGGGSGGGPGGMSVTRFLAGALPSSVDLVVGAHGSGGAAQTSNATNGIAGGTGGKSYFGALASSAYFVSAEGGSAGAGGTTAAVAGGAAGVGRVQGTTGGTGNNVSAGANPSSPTVPAPTGGGGGGGLVATTRTTRDGGAGGGYSTTNGFNTVSHTNTVAAGGVGATKTAAQNGTATGYDIGTGQGGGGGWCNNDGTAGDGGNGASPGGGGGGGGGSNNGTNSGKGGDGADGAVTVISYL